MDGAADFGAEEAAMQAYFQDGERRALALGNRGPIRFTADGALHPQIMEAYLRNGFYVFDGVLGGAELAELKADIMDMIERLPARPGAAVDTQGRPALGLGLEGKVVGWAKPLSDPLGATGAGGGRYPVKMTEPKPADGAPDETPFAISGPLQFSDAALRVYGHPGLLGVAAAVNGADFAPFNEAVIVKKPGEGAAFAWHQDGMTYWDRPEWTPLVHGFNFMAQLFDCTAANAVWYVPGSHAGGKADIKGMAARAGGDRLPDAVPLICKAGDVAMSNRQLVHGSFPNTSPDWRVTFNMGFHQRASVEGADVRGYDGLIHHYDDELVRKRAEVIGLGIAARRLRFPDEAPFVYRPHAAAREVFVWDEAARSGLRDYHLSDLFI